MESAKRVDATAMKVGQEYHAIHLYVINSVDTKATVHTVENVYARRDSEETTVMKGM
jgi:hypothetical protein